jgi:hypothetical protein
MGNMIVLQIDLMVTFFYLGNEVCTKCDNTTHLQPLLLVWLNSKDINFDNNTNANHYILYL